MNKSITKHFFGRTVMLLLTLSASITAMAEAQKIGKSDTYWELTGNTLTISGTGDMPTFSKVADQPWVMSRPNIHSIVIEDGVTSIGQHAFSSNSYVTSVSIGTGVSNIDMWAFEDCTSLQTISIPGNVQTIQQKAFEGCTGLNTITLNEGLTTIIQSAFKDCSSLTSITIPASVTTIGTNPFDGCSSLATITVAAGNTTFTSPNNNCLINNTTHTLITGTSVIPSDAGITKIDDSAFYGRTDLTGSITIPEGVTEIKTKAFNGCTGLTAVTLPNILRKIYSSAFDGCTNLSSVTFGTNIDEISMDAFRNTALTEVEIPCNPYISPYGSFPSTTTVKLTLTANAAGEAKWMSFYNPSNSFKADANTIVYKAAIVDSKVKLTAIADKIVPKQKAVVLKSTSDPVMTLTTDEATGDFSDNILKSVDYSSSSIPANCYTLANGTNGVGFYKYTGTKINAYKAYLIYSASSRSFLGIATDDETTAIDTATMEETEGV